eukprot:CAMPEP_0204273180 /NCGR_PEP_ID=MMETSP0468-20130131/22768_1 /ASSEMBLY_ACC=CAM_ASM_000383 /TAXON_ID=2969 /ORGANISM="Oxyrrhis marina" /LENGTH=455 /DNA_ID=CAMNT_0051249153 /DNA_START=10 /DNA_END=1377 /DNA_ORIENTATION=-
MVFLLGVAGTAGSLLSLVRHSGEPLEITLEHGEGLYSTKDALRIGTPPQPVAALFDTGSFDLLGFSRRCLGACFYAKHMGGAYSPDQSTTFHGLSTELVHGKNGTDVLDKNLVELTFGQGTAVCLPGSDAVVLAGKGHSLRVKELHFLEGVWAQRSLGILMEQDVTAIVGLGKSKNPNDPQGFNRTHRTLLEQLRVNVFSLCYGAGEDAPGKILFNDPLFASSGFMQSREIPEAVQEVKVIGHVHWGAHVSNIAINGTSMGCKASKCAAIVDSGTSLLLLPKDVIEHVGALLGKYEVKNDCSGAEKLPVLHFMLEGPKGPVEVKLPPSSYLAHLEGEVTTDPIARTVAKLMGKKIAAKTHISTCQALMMPMDQKSEFGNMIVLGHPVFSEYIVSFKPAFPWGMYFQKSPQVPGDCLARHPSQSVLERGAEVPAFRKLSPAGIKVPNWLGTDTVAF